MYDDKRESPPLTETNEVVKTADKTATNDSPDSADITLTDAISTDVNSTLELSFDLIPPFKFAKSATTDEIVNVDADLIDMDSFQYVTKPSLVKAIVYLIKNVDQVNKDLSSAVVLPVSSDNSTHIKKSDSCCQYATEDFSSDNASDSNVPCSLSPNTHNQVDRLNDILQSFQSTLLQCVDEKLSMVDNKISDAISQLTSDNHVKSFAEVAAKAAKNVEDIAKNTISSVENVAKQSIDKVNNKTITQESEVATVTEDSNNSTHCAEGNPSSKVFLSNDTVIIKSYDNDNSEVLVLSSINPRTAYLQSKVDSVKKTLRDKLQKVPFEFANDKSKTGKIALKFPTPLAYEKAEAIIDTTFLASVGFESKKARKMLPKITIRGIPSYLTQHIDTTNLNTDQIRDAKKQNLTNQLRDKNPCIDTLVNAGHTFQIVYINSNSNSEDLVIGLKVSPLIRATILSEQNGFIFIGSKRCLFNDRFDVGQCYHCQLLGHNSQNCPNKNEHSTCLYCMGNHRSSSCSFKNQTDKHCCAKCHSSSESGDNLNYQSHNSASPNCPIYVRECQRLANMTDFCSKNVM